MNFTTTETKMTASKSKGAVLPIIVMLAIAAGVILPIAGIYTAVASIWLPLGAAASSGLVVGSGVLLIGLFADLLTPATPRV